MGLNVFMLFVGFGLGSLLFGQSLSAWGLDRSLWLFGGLQLLASLAAVPLFRTESRGGPAANMLAGPANRGV
ncbi:hypothetical protein J4558_26740 [Leptolyngbya sp. 15MV]|nr:hypothetical protein J4558_26740 [Leptolyngbya sp. 15MV]